MAAQPQERVRKRLAWFSPVLLAVALSPAFMQTQFSCDRGDTYLSPLQVEVGGYDQVDGFHPDTRYYDIAISGDNILLRAVTRDPTSTATFQLYVDGSLVEADTLGVGGGEVTLGPPVGASRLNVSVRATQGGIGNYEVDIVRLPKFACTEQGILDAIAFGDGPHFFDCNGPTTVTTLDEIFIYNDVILDGEGNLTVDGNDDHRVLSVVPGVTAELVGMTVSGGPVGLVGDQGLGIFNEGTLTIRDSVVENNGDSYEGLAQGAGIYSTGTLSLLNSVVRRNGSWSGDGAGIYSTGTATLIGSEVSGNNGGYGTCGVHSTGTLTLIDTQVGPNGCGNGGMIRSVGGPLNIINSTVGRNTGSFGGILSSGIATVINSTIEAVKADKTIWHSGGLFTLIGSTVVGNRYDGTLGGGPFFVSNSAIVIWPLANGYSWNCGGSFTSGGGNIESPGDTCSFDQPTDLVNVTAEELALGPLADYGGPTMTRALLPGSVAIDHVPAAMCVDDNGDPLTTDQRGVARPQGAACDAGAFEYADCSGSVCDDGNDCTADHCDPSDASWCVNNAVPDGTLCDFGGLAGTCVSGTCDPSLFPCTEQGILDAIARGGGPYTFACNGPTTVTTLAEIVIDNDVILDGEGNLTIDGNDDHLVISVVTGVEAELRGSTVSGGAAGGIANNGTLMLTNSTVSGNQGGGISNGGGTLTLTNSTVSNNMNTPIGGGIRMGAGTVTLTNSTVSNNTSDATGGGIANYDGELTLTNSTVSGNTSGFGGGIYTHDGPVTLTNITVSGNTASYLSGGSGGGIHMDGGMLTLTNSTVSGNTSNGVGGIDNGQFGTMTLTNTLIDNACSNAGTIASGGGNFESPGNTCGFEQPTDQVSVPDPMLGPLQNNGGPTMTHALLPGSDAIDQILVVDCLVTEDQRGLPRPGGTMCDVGAFEVQP